MKHRLHALDALRGLAIVGMIFSGSIAFGGKLPGWMYHRQNPPPTHSVDSSLLGITWVDVVFPMFLVAMGAAIPLAYGKHLGQSPWRPLAKAVKRTVLLLLFALYIRHLNPWVLGGAPEHWLLALLGFVSLLFLFGIPGVPLGKWTLAVGAALGGVAVWLCAMVQPLSLARFDSILAILAVAYLFVSVVYLVAANRWWLYAALALVLAGAHSAGLVAPFQWSWLSGLVSGQALLYAACVLGGVVVALQQLPKAGSQSWMAAVLVVVLVATLWLWWQGWFLAAALAPAVAGLAGALAPRQTEANGARLWWWLVVCSVAAALATELSGAISKTPATGSYMLVGLSLSLLLLLTLQLVPADGVVPRVLAAVGRNPLLAYVLPSLLFWPLVGAVGLEMDVALWSKTSVVAGLAKGVVATAAMVALVLVANRLKLVWKL